MPILCLSLAIISDASQTIVYDCHRDISDSDLIDLVCFLRNGLFCEDIEVPRRWCKWPT